MSEHEQSPMASPARDIRKLKQNSTAAAGELKEFLGKIRGKSPKEMLGVVASSGLVQSFIQATIAMAVLVLALTAVPYTWSQIFPDKGDDPAENQAAADTEPATAPATDTTENPAAPPAAEPAAAAAAGETSPQPGAPADLKNPGDFIDKLGVGEQKDAPSNVNPLEKSADDLLKGLD